MNNFLLLFLLFFVVAAAVAVAIVVAITITVAVAIVIAAIAIVVAAAVVEFAVDVVFNMSEVFVEFFAESVEVGGFVFEILNGESEIFEEVSDLGKEFAFVGGGVNIHTFNKAFEISSFFSGIHSNFLSVISMDLYSFEIFAGTGVDSDLVAFVDEHRYLDLGAGFNNCKFGDVGGGVAFYARFCLGDLEFDERGRLNGEYVALVGNETAGIAFFDEFEVFGEFVGIEGNLIVGFHIHKVVKIAVGIAVLHIFSFNYCGGEFCGGVKGLFNDRTGNDVAEFGSYESGAFAGFDVLEFDDLHYRSFHFKSKAVSEIACCYHIIMILSIFNNYIDFNARLRVCQCFFAKNIYFPYKIYVFLRFYSSISSFGDLVRPIQPSLVISTISSILTPYLPSR